MEQYVGDPLYLLRGETFPSSETKPVNGKKHFSVHWTKQVDLKTIFMSSSSPYNS